MKRCKIANNKNEVREIKLDMRDVEEAEDDGDEKVRYRTWYNFIIQTLSLPLVCGVGALFQKEMYLTI